MPAKAAQIAIAILVATTVAACGESAPKRSVDARTEVLRFFAVDAPAVFVLQPDPWAAVLALDDAAGGSTAWTGLRGMALGPLRSAGVGLPQLRRLMRPAQEVEGLEAAALAVGAASPRDLLAGRPLLVLATDRSELLSRLLRDAARDGPVRPAGDLDEAKLYRAPGASFAVRDGVLVSAPQLGQVRSAIQRRDGDSDLQLDEDVVEALFNDLDPQGPLLVYANLAGVREADAGVRQLARREPWTGKLGKGAASARAVDGELRIENFAQTSGGDFSSGELPLGTNPTPFIVTTAGAGALIPLRGPIRTLLAGLAPISGEATASEDEVRLKLTAGG